MTPLGCESGVRTAARERLRFPRASYSLSRDRAVAAGLAAFCLALCLTVILPGAAQAVTFNATGVLFSSCDGDSGWSATDSAGRDLGLDAQTDDIQTDCDRLAPTDQLLFEFTGGDNPFHTLTSIELEISAWHHRIDFDEPPSTNTNNAALDFDANGLGIATAPSFPPAPDPSDPNPLTYGTGGKIGGETLEPATAYLTESLRLGFGRDVLLTGVELWTDQANVFPGVWIGRESSRKGRADPRTTHGKSYQLTGSGDRIVSIDLGAEDGWDTWADVFHIGTRDSNNGDTTRGFRLQGFSFMLVNPEDRDQDFSFMLVNPEDQDHDFSPFRLSAERFGDFIDSGDCISGGALTDTYVIDANQQCQDGQGLGWQFRLDAAREERQVIASLPADADDTTRVRETGYGLSLVVTGGSEADEISRTDFHQVVLDADDAAGGRGLGVRATEYHNGDTPNLVASLSQAPSVLLPAGIPNSECEEDQASLPPLNNPDNCWVAREKFLELNFLEVETEAPTETVLSGDIESTGLASLDRIRLTALDIWTQSAAPQSFQVRALEAWTLLSPPPRNRLGHPVAAQADFTTSESAPCANGVGYCQSFVTDLLSDIGRFLIVGREFVTSLNSSTTAGIRLRGFSFRLEPFVPLPEPDLPEGVVQDLNPFRFSAEGFDAFVDNDDCVTGGALTEQYGIAETRHCPKGGTNLQRAGWQFELPGEAMRQETTVDDDGKATATRYGLQLVVTGGRSHGLESTQAPSYDEFVSGGDYRGSLEVDGVGADAGRGIGVSAFGPGYTRDINVADSFNIAARAPHPNVEGSPNEFPDNCGTDSPGDCHALFYEFLELNFIEAETGRSEFTGGEPIETDSLERIRLTGLEIWTQSNAPQSFQVRALGEEKQSDRGSLQDPVVSLVDLVTDNAQPCTPLDGSAGTSPGWCQSFDFDLLDLVSHVGRFLIVGTQLADNGANKNAGIRLRSFSYEFQTAMEEPEIELFANPFVFSASQFDLRIDNGDCIADGALLADSLAAVAPRTEAPCRRGGRGLGWQFDLGASREQRTVTSSGGDARGAFKTRTTNHGLSLVVTGGWEGHEAHPNDYDGVDTDPGNFLILQAENSGRGLGVRSFAKDDSFNIATHTDTVGGAPRVLAEFVELNFEELMIGGAMETFSDEQSESSGEFSLERVRLTALDIWTELSGAQSFRVEAAANDDLDPRTRDEEREFLALHTSASAQCANGLGFCQTFVTDLLSDAGRFFIFGTQATGGEDRGIRLRGFSFRVEPLLAPPPEPDLPDGVEQDLNPFRFSAEGFNAFVNNDDCVTGGALTAQYAIPVEEQCRASAGGTSTGEGWEFTLPVEAARTETVVDEASGETAIVGYGLRLTVTPGEANPRDPTGEIPGVIVDRPFLEADDAEGGRGLGVRSHIAGHGPRNQRQDAIHDSANLAMEEYPTFIPFGTGPRLEFCKPGTFDESTQLCDIEVQEFIELNFSEYEYDRNMRTVTGLPPTSVEADSLEAVELTGLEIWTQTETPQSFEVRALWYETSNANRLFDRVRARMELTTDNAQPCTPLDGSDGTSEGYCQSFSFDDPNNPFFSEVGRFLIVGTQINNNPMAGIRLRTIQYKFQAQIPLPGGLALALTGLAGLGGIALRRRRLLRAA